MNLSSDKTQAESRKKRILFVHCKYYI